jgi:release factor glutamine methyltransferase
MAEARVTRGMLVSDSHLTVREAVRQAAEKLASAGCDTPRLDAELLLGTALGVDRARLIVHAGDEVGRDSAERFWRLVARRAAREPVAYITGFKEFRRLSLAIDRRVLVPRPETELLVEVGLGLERGASVIDVGTGSGAVALALKDERPELAVVGTDADADALVLARANAARLRLDVRFAQGDLLAGIPLRPDAVLANLPYVPEDSPSLPPELDYEPRAALFAGSDGLEAIRRLVSMSGGVALLALEVGCGQAEAVEVLLRAAEFADVKRLRDLAGHERVLVGRR